MVRNNITNKVKTNISEVQKTLRGFGLLSKENPYCLNELDYNKKYSKEFKSIRFSDDYVEIYKVAISNSDYDLLLVDDSFFQFSCYMSNGHPILGYCYYPNPLSFKDYNEFKEKYGIEHINDVQYELYEHFIDEKGRNQSTFPIRFDYDFSSYKKYCHPKSHIHFGYSDIRLPVNHVLTPELFLYIIFMFFYKVEWNKIIETHEYLNRLSKLKEKSINLLEDSFLDEDEKKFIFLD